MGDQRGNIEPSLDPSNQFPWCLVTDPTVDPDGSLLQAFAHQYAFNGQDLPICPDDIGQPWAYDFKDGKQLGWQNSGAINAGLSVFEFLDKFIKGEIPHIGYDECEKLSASN